MSEGNKVTLKSGDEKLFEVDLLVALESQMLKDMIEEIGVESRIPVSNVTGDILALVIEFCKYHVESQKSSDKKPAIPEEEMKKWDTEFILQFDYRILAKIIRAANYLNIKSLMELATQTVAEWIKGKTPAEIREHFGIENDFGPGEEEAIRKENQWVFD